MKFFLTAFFLSWVLFSYSQEKAPDGSYSINIKSPKQMKDLELNDTDLLDIEGMRKADRDTTVRIRDMRINVMSREKWNNNVVWSKYILVPKEK